MYTVEFSMFFMKIKFDVHQEAQGHKGELKLVSYDTYVRVHSKNSGDQI
jgi:hypothetical protein